MISKESGRKKEILQELKKLNKAGYEHMMAPFSTFKPKYKALQKSKTWEKAKELLIEYFTLTQFIVKCPICMKNTANDFVLHHEEYKPSELFTPKFIQFIHKRCHTKTHLKWY